MISQTSDADSVQALTTFLRRRRRLVVLTGAGCSTASGIPDYRDRDGNWKHSPPMQYADFIATAGNRRRYWSRSFAGWQRMAKAMPNAAHGAIASIEANGRVRCVITQNVDDLHRKAGSRNVVDLHGVLNRVRCLSCNASFSRDDFQAVLEQANPEWRARVTMIAPDGDAHLAAVDHSSFVVPDCRNCGGVLKPDVVFFGEQVPASRVAEAFSHVREADGLLIVGSSLMVYSGFRFAREAAATGIPIAIVNIGTTRADDLAELKVAADCTAVLPTASDALAA